MRGITETRSRGLTRGLPDRRLLGGAAVLVLINDECAVACELPNRPLPRRHELKDSKKSRHEADSYSISISKGYRVIYVPRDGVNVWYWIGSHADYDAFTGG
jgi:hypothetical protein